MASQKEQDIQLMLAAQCHLGTKNLDYRMERYIYKRRADGIYLINLEKTWEKLRMAAQIIVAIESPMDVVAQSARPYGQRPVFKFAQYVGCQSIAGRHTPGTFTNQIQKQFQEPRLLIVTDPRTDHQPVKESSYVGIPVIALCDTDSPLHYVDVAIPCNNRSQHALAVMYWLLARTVLQMRGTLPVDHVWDVMVDLFIYREPEETAESEEASPYAGASALPLATGAPDEWGGDAGAGYGGGLTGFEAADNFMPTAVPVPPPAFADSFGDSFEVEPPAYTAPPVAAPQYTTPPPPAFAAPSDDSW